MLLLGAWIHRCEAVFASTHCCTAMEFCTSPDACVTHDKRKPHAMRPVRYHTILCWRRKTLGTLYQKVLQPSSFLHIAYWKAAEGCSMVHQPVNELLNTRRVSGKHAFCLQRLRTQAQQRETWCQHAAAVTIPDVHAGAMRRMAPCMWNALARIPLSRRPCTRTRPRITLASCWRARRRRRRTGWPPPRC